MAFTIEVERKEEDEKFSFEDLELYHQECYGGKVVQECVNDREQWKCKCTRCGNEISSLSSEKIILITQTAIDGLEREFNLGPYSPMVCVIQRGKAKNLSRLTPASLIRDKQAKVRSEGLDLFTGNVERPKEVREMGNISKWVTRKEAKWRDLLYSTSERRLVTVASNSPIGVIPIGEYRVPLLRRYDSLAFVSMGPKQVDVSLKGNAGTSDGVTVEGKVSVQVIIHPDDEESNIKRIAADPEEEERLLSNSILTAVQETIASHTWYEIMSIGDGFVQTIELKLSELLSKSHSCFFVRSLTIQEIRPQNKTLVESLEKAAREKEEEKLQRDLTLLKAEREALERKSKEEELEGELRMQKLQHQRELEDEREKLELQQEKDEAQISTQKRLSELLETEAGRIAVLPQDMFRLLLRKIDAEITSDKEIQKLYRDFLRTSQSFQAGQFNAMKALLAQHLNIRLSEELPALALSEGEAQQTDNESEDSSKTPDLSDD